MIDEKEFMQAVRSVAEIAKTSDHALSKEEILAYFDGMELSKEQENLVFEYIKKAPYEKETGFAEENGEGNKELNEASKSQKKAEELFLTSTFTKMYLDDLKGMEKLAEEEMQPYYEALLAGKKEAAVTVMNHFLESVIEIAKRYVLLGVNMDDVVQEGNMALVMAVEELRDRKEQLVVEDYVKGKITTAMEQYIDAALADEDWEKVVLQRAVLLREAEETLAKELVRTPTTKELCDYTKLSEEEIEDIKMLIKEKAVR